MVLEMLVCPDNPGERKGAEHESKEYDSGRRGCVRGWDGGNGR